MNLRPVLPVLLLCLLLLCSAAGATYIQPTTPVTTQPPIRSVTVVRTITAPPAGALAIASTPPGATVILDGEHKGSTPLTVRPIAAGSHSLILTLDGYEDFTASVTTGAGVTQVTYTLVPVTRATTPLPVRVLPTIVIPPRTVPVQNLSAQYKFPRPVSILPLTITVAGQSKTPRLSTLSPYFAAQLATPSGIAGPSDVFTNATSFIEVDSYNVYLPQSHLMSGAEMALDPVWGDEDTVYIATADRFFNNTNFRWISAEKGVTGFYQVSRFPFDANASHWQNEYAPGLVSSGPVKDVYAGKDGFHYFSLNFAAIANHNPSDPPIYTGVAQLEETVPGKGKPMGAVRIPLTGIVIWTKKGTAGPFTVPVPAGIAFLAAGEHTESELGNPNANLILSSSAVSSRAATATESAIANLPRTYYVRVVPMHDDGTGGVPTIPVTVTVVRPQPCPPQPPANTEQDITVRPPSGTVASFYMTSFIPDWIHTDQDGALVSRAHFVTVTSPPACTAPKATPAGIMSGDTIDQLNAQTCAQYGGSQPGYHFYADPKETHWYDTVWDIITGLFSAFGQVIHAVSVAWNDIQNLAAEITARYLSTIVLLGLYHCEDHPECVDVIHTADSAALAAFGIPPTIPDVSDLEGMGADYMAKVAAEELGAGGVVDAAKDVYNNLPDNVQQSIKDKANDVGDSLTGSLVSQSGSAASAAAGGNFYIPDPLFYEPHPAMVMVKVFNPNNAPTDPVEMSVRDSAGLFRQSQSYYIPSLAPQDSTVIPVMLEEDYSKVYTKDCSANAYTSTCGDICVPCYWNLWYFALIDNSKAGGDTFSVDFSAKKNGFSAGGLTPSSSGTVLSGNTIITFDEQGKSCGAYNAKTVLTYPAGWQMEQNSLNRDLWSLCWLKYSFTGGEQGRLIGG